MLRMRGLIELVISWVRVELGWAMVFKAIPHLILNKLTSWQAYTSNVNSNENLAEKTALFATKIGTKYNPLLWNIIQLHD